MRFNGLTRRQSLTLGASTGLAFLAGRAQAQDLSGVTLRVGTYKGYDKTLLPRVGLDNTPYKVQFAEFTSGQLIIEAMNGHALDVGSWSEIPQAYAAASGADIRAIAVLQGDVNDQAIIVQKDLPIHSSADLKGKRVGYVRATTSHYFLLRMLWQAGLDVSDIQAINLGVPDGAAAFAAGQLDAWAIYGYPIEIALAQGNARVLKTALGILSGNYFIGVPPALLNDPAKSAAVADYLQRLAKGWEWENANKTAWAQTLAPLIHVPLPLVEQELANQSQPNSIVAITQPAINSAQAVADTFAKVGLLPGGVKVAPYFETRFNSVLSQPVA